MRSFKKIYGSRRNMSEQDYEKSRNTFVIEGMLATTIGNLSMGVFLAGYVLYLGGSQEFSGLLLTIPMYTSIVQIFTPIIYEKQVSRKAIVAILAPVHRIMLGLMAFIPLIFQDTTTRLTVLFALYAVSFVILQLTNPAAINWIMSLVPDEGRGKYYGRRDSFMLATSTFFSISMGFVLDFFKQTSPGTGFFIIYLLVLVFAILNFYFLSKIKEPRVQIRYYKDAYTGRKIPAGANFKQIFIVPFLDEKFRKIIGMASLWQFSVMIAIAYFAIYQVNVLKLDYSFMTFCIMLQTVTMVIFARVWGKFADRRNWFVTLRIAIMLLSLCHVCWFFIFHSVIYLVPFMYILGGVCWSGINMAFFNIPYKYSPQKGKTIFLSLYGAILGVVSLGASLVGALFVKTLGFFTLNIFGLAFTSMQLLFLFSGAMMIGVAFYIKKQFEKSELFMTIPSKIIDGKNA